MLDELKDFVISEINGLVIEPTTVAFHGLTDEENARFIAYMNVLEKIHEIEGKSIELDIRYCSKRDCSCSPESDVTYLLKDLTEDDLNKLIPDMPLSEVSGKWIKSVVWNYKRKELR